MHTLSQELTTLAPMFDSLQRNEEINIRIHLPGSSLSSVAVELGAKATTVSSSSQGSQGSRRIELAIDINLNETPGRLWPERSGQATKGRA